jgi:hypothetical protein
VLLDFDRAIASGKRMGDTIEQVVVMVVMVVVMVVVVVVMVGVVLVMVVMVVDHDAHDDGIYDASCQTFVRSRKRQNTSSKMGFGMSTASVDQSGNVDKGAFGFEEGSEYTMTEFKRKVDQFNKIVCLRKGLESLAEVEEYYWKVVTTGEENLTVEYGNDLDVGTYSSAFPRPEDDFGQHPWNLNQLPRESGSLLRNMTFDVNGVSRPWLYVAPPPSWKMCNTFACTLAWLSRPFVGIMRTITFTVSTTCMQVTPRCGTGSLVLLPVNSSTSSQKKSQSYSTPTEICCTASPP